MSIPKNITADHLSLAIARIDREGVPANAHSSTYDLVVGDQIYPPKLVLSWANVYANGKELDRTIFEGGKGTPCFQLLEQEGFIIQPKVKALPDFSQYQREDVVEAVFGEPNIISWQAFIDSGLVKKSALIAFHIISCVAGNSREQSRGIINTHTLALYRINQSIYTSEAFNPATNKVKNLLHYSEDNHFGFVYRQPIVWKTQKTFDDIQSILNSEWAGLVASQLDTTLEKVKKYLSQYSQIGKRQDVMIDIYPTIEKFIAQSSTSDLTTRAYIKEAYDLKFKASFGMGAPARVPWMTLLHTGQKTSKGIYPGYLLFKKENILLLTYGTSEENKPPITWPELSAPTVKEYLQTHYDTKPARYAETKVYTAYSLDEDLDREKINQDLKNLVDIYKSLFSNLPPVLNSSCPQVPVMKSQPLNQILYGPPGTGKTYHTIDAALKIIDPDFYDQNRNDRAALKAHFELLKDEGLIGFTTFHQSFAYEDFVEGLKAETEEGVISYVVEPGIFRRFCVEEATIAEVSSTDRVDVSNRTIWKMSLGNTLKDNDFIYDHCIEKGEIRHGAGGDFDLAGSSTRQSIRQRFQDNGLDVNQKRGAISLAHMFKNEMEVSDLLIITDGNLKFRAIGEIIGDYEWLLDDDLLHYSQTRKVKWHRVYEESLPYEKIMDRKFTQASIYKPSRKALNIGRLQTLLGGTSELARGDSIPIARNKVLIIDEINRGNISSIFGELITLIEPSKRRGAAEALSVMLPYSKEELSVPGDLYLIGTMNTADRSLALMDTALRRRFDFIEMMPDTSLLSELIVDGINIQKMLDVINQRIQVLYDREHTLGHAFFMPLIDCPENQRFSLLESIFSEKILPLLEEYFFEDWEKIRLVLGDNQKADEHQFIRVNKSFNHEKLFGSDDAYHVIDEGAVIYDRFIGRLTPMAYIAIYNV